MYEARNAAGMNTFSTNSYGENGGKTNREALREEWSEWKTRKYEEGATSPRRHIRRIVDTLLTFQRQEWSDVVARRQDVPSVRTARRTTH